jgi:hypothetical protein
MWLEYVNKLKKTEFERYCLPSGNSVDFVTEIVYVVHDRLWVHFSCLCFISFYVVYLLHKVSGFENLLINPLVLFSFFLKDTVSIMLKAQQMLNQSPCC